MDASSDHLIQQEAPMVDWSSLPADIVKEVGSCILATGDVDYYMNLRAVCHDWRAATDDPKAHRLTIASASSSGSYSMRSPGGAMKMRKPLAASSSTPPLAASSANILVLDTRSAFLAKPDAELFTMVEYDMAYKVRMVWGIGEENEEKISDLMRSIDTVFPDEMRLVYHGHHFVVSGGDMLLVILRPHRHGVDVFKVDNTRNVIEPVKCIGGRALFLGDRCISVDANKFSSIDGDYIYYLSSGGIHMYDLIKDEEEVANMDTTGLVLSGVADNSRPPSMIQLLIIYCIDTPWSQLCLK